MKFEEVLPALRAGKRVRRAGWSNKDAYYRQSGLYVTSGPHGCLVPSVEVFADDWEVVPEPRRVADYWVPCGYSSVAQMMTKVMRKTIETGKQPEGAVLIPGTEREVEND